MNIRDIPSEGGDTAESGGEQRSPGGIAPRLRRFLRVLTRGRAGGFETIMGETPAASGATRRQTRRMLGKLVSFSRLRVDDVLVPRADIIAIEASASVRELFGLFVAARHSRLPVYRETLDDILGMVHIKDLLALMRREAKERRRGDAPAALTLPAAFLEETVEASGLMRPLLFAPPSMPAGDLLMKMQSTHLHMAIVVDEYGGAEGVVTIEDLVEEIVGEIVDEHDEEDRELITPAPGGYVVSARADIRELEKLLGVDLLPPEQDEETDTVGGLVFAMLGRVPVRGEIIRHESGIEFEVLEADPRRVKKVRIAAPPGKAGQEG